MEAGTKVLASPLSLDYRARRSGWVGSITLISSAFTALLNCAEVGRRNRILTNYRFLSHSLLYIWLTKEGIDGKMSVRLGGHGMKKILKSFKFYLLLIFILLIGGLQIQHELHKRELTQFISWKPRPKLVESQFIGDGKVVFYEDQKDELEDQN